jgi:hypothetical protein
MSLIDIMSLIDFPFELQNNTFTSKRIYKKNALLFKNVTIDLEKSLREVENSKDLKIQMRIIINIYETIIKNYELMSIYSKTHNYFCDVVYFKGITIKNDLLKHIEESKKVKTIYKNFVSVYSRFVTKHMDCIFQHIKKNKMNSSYSCNDCPICLEVLNKNIVVTDCRHCFHKECLFIHNREKNTCPICRKILF